MDEELAVVFTDTIAVMVGETLLRVRRSDRSPLSERWTVAGPSLPAMPSFNDREAAIAKARTWAALLEQARQTMSRADQLVAAVKEDANLVDKTLREAAVIYPLEEP